jgi:N-acetylglucosaminyldiphosphoundecaprenol N-acetyl-beta-D-mannosaminyltransferase
LQQTITLIVYYGAGNLGDELLLESSINIIRSIDANAQINIFSQSPKLTSETYSAYKCFNKFNILDIYSALISSRALVFGGGSIFQDSSSFKSLIYYCVIALSFKCFGKKIILLGQGIGPLKNSISRLICQIVYKVADFVNVRDQESFEMAKSWGLDEKRLSKGIDLVWYLDHPQKSNTNLDTQSNTESNTLSNTILISLRDTKNFQEKELLLFAKHLHKHHSESEFILFAFQKNDLKILIKLTEYLNKYNVKNSINEIYTLQDWTSNGEKLFLNSHMIYSMRFHGVMLAAKLNIPCIGLAYDPKVSSLCKEINLPYLVFNNQFEKQLETLSLLLKIKSNVVDNEYFFANIDIHFQDLRRNLKEIILSNL